jgi:hypothetical protein
MTLQNYNVAKKTIRYVRRYSCGVDAGIGNVQLHYEVTKL